MRKYRSFGETNPKYGVLSITNFERNEKKKKKVRGNKLIFNFGLRSNKEKV